MIPLRMEIKARQLSDLSRWSSHEGEEFIYVLRGSIELQRWKDPARQGSTGAGPINAFGRLGDRMA